MVTISPLTHVTLKHRPFSLAVSDSGHVAAFSAWGSGALISPDFRSVTPFAFPHEFMGAALSPDGSMLAIAATNGTTLLSTSTFEKIHRFNDSFESCRFDANNRLWTCARFSTATVIVEVWEPGTWRKIAKTKITDSYGYFWLLPHPDRNCMVVSAAARQAGRCLFWASLGSDGINLIRSPELKGTTWPTFSPSGDEFLVISEGELRRYCYPRGPLHAKMRGLRESEDDNLGEFVYYVDAGHALVASLNYRLFLVDVENMEVEDEVVILGHEPHPAAELHPFLKDDRGLASDMVLMFPVPGSKFLSLHSEFRGAHRADSDDRLLTWQLPATL